MCESIKLRSRITILLLLAAFMDVSAQELDPAALAKKVLQELDAEDFQTRQRASKELDKLPASVVPHFEEALQKNTVSPEVRTRLLQVMDTLRVKVQTIARVQSLQRMTDYYTKDLLDAYDRAGSKDPRWDDDVRKAFGLFAQWLSSALAPRDTELDDLLELQKRAIAAGCNDPLLLFTHARLYEWIVLNKDPEVTIRLHTQAAETMSKSEYSSLRKALACFRAADIRTIYIRRPNDQQKKQTQQFFEEGLRLLPQVLILPEVIKEDRFGLLFAGYEAARRIANDREKGLQRLLSVLNKTQLEEPIVYRLKGTHYLNATWDARGSGFDYTVSEEGWRQLRRLLPLAQAAFEKAWALDSEDISIVEQMIRLIRMYGYPREQMELWFQRGLALNPDHQQIHREKLIYLSPRWHGNAEELMKFARACFDSRKWAVRLPFLLVEAHETLCYKNGHYDYSYFRDPAVWEEIEAVYKTYLKTHPQSMCERAFWVKLSFNSGRYEAARADFEYLLAHPQYLRIVNLIIGESQFAYFRERMQKNLLNDE